MSNTRSSVDSSNIYQDIFTNNPVYERHIMQHYQQVVKYEVKEKLKQIQDWPTFLTTNILIRNSNHRIVSGTPLQIALKTVNGDMAEILKEYLINHLSNGEEEIWKQVHELSLEKAELNNQFEQYKIALYDVYEAIKQNNHPHQAIDYFCNYLNETPGDNFENMVDLMSEAYKLHNKHAEIAHSRDCFKSYSFWAEDRLGLFRQVMRAIESHLPDNLARTRNITNNKPLTSIYDGEIQINAIDPYIKPQKRMVENFKIWAESYNPNPIFPYTKISCHLYLQFMKYMFDQKFYVTTIPIIAIATAAFLVPLSISCLIDLPLSIVKNVNTFFSKEQRSLHQPQQCDDNFAKRVLKSY